MQNRKMAAKKVARPIVSRAKADLDLQVPAEEGAGGGVAEQRQRRAAARRDHRKGF
jgi:hypothetical protein